MTKEDVRKVYPTAQFQPSIADVPPFVVSPPFGSGIEYGYIVIPNWITPNSERYAGSPFNGIFDIKYKMLNSRIYEIHVEYQKSLYFESLEQFSEAISPKLGLPDKWWLAKSAAESENAVRAIQSSNDRTFGLECGNYSFVTGYHPQYFDTRYYVKAIDETLLKKAEAIQEKFSDLNNRQREEANRQKMENFKP